MKRNHNREEHTCNADDCSFVFHGDNISSCKRNPANVHICNDYCPFLYHDRLNGDQITCLLTSLILVNSMSMSRTCELSWKNQIVRSSAVARTDDDKDENKYKYSKSEITNCQISSIVAAFIGHLRRNILQTREAAIRSELSAFVCPDDVELSSRDFMSLVALYANARNKIIEEFDNQYARLVSSESDIVTPVVRMWHIINGTTSVTERRVVLFSMALFTYFRTGVVINNVVLWPPQRMFAVFPKRVQLVQLAGEFTAHGNPIQPKALQAVFRAIGKLLKMQTKRRKIIDAVSTILDGVAMQADDEDAAVEKSQYK